MSRQKEGCLVHAWIENIYIYICYILVCPPSCLLLLDYSKLNLYVFGDEGYLDLFASPVYTSTSISLPDFNDFNLTDVSHFEVQSLWD